jgi:zinc/manganese transport system substrate-binding protein
MTTYRRLLFLALAGLVIAALALPVASPVVQAQGKELHVIASTSILADVAANVAGSAASVESLLPIGANTHTAEPSAQDVARLSNADVVLVVGANYEETLLSVIEQAAGDKLVVTSDCVPIRPITASTGASGGTGPGATPTPASTPTQGAAMESRCAAYDQIVTSTFHIDQAALTAGTVGPLYTLDCGGTLKGGNIPVAGGCDPHVWSDPTNAAFWALTIRDTLSARDPANAAVYQQNTQQYLAALATLNTEVQGLIDQIPPEHRTLVTNHLAFDYFAARYGLQLIGVIIPGGSTVGEPSTQEVLALIQAIQDHHVPAIFTENVASDNLAKQIASETGAKVVPLYTESLGGKGSGADTYINYMLYNAKAIAGALK